MRAVAGSDGCRVATERRVHALEGKESRPLLIPRTPPFPEPPTPRRGRVQPHHRAAFLVADAGLLGKSFTGENETRTAAFGGSPSAGPRKPTVGGRLADVAPRQSERFRDAGRASRGSRAPMDAPIAETGAGLAAGTGKTPVRPPFGTGHHGPTHFRAVEPQ